MNNELKARGFLKRHIWSQDKISESDKRYRYEHSLRVAAVGRKIAVSEDLDKEALTLGCILHDVGTFDSRNNPREHGRVSAKIAREFLKTLDLPKEKVEEICYGIAIHVDDKADFHGEKTILNESISDSDNIDRFDSYRIYDTLRYLRFHEMTVDEQLDYLNKVIPKLKGYTKQEFATKTATAMWTDNVSFQIQFYERLKCQLQAGQI
ncbi:HD domain-containing protein [Clostridium sp. YIM B02515]|uniref:HD domain-containing protein n=1 Tax=Clostridium rhizosphaerae TaxID=2803861 RepID=A0ABS1TCF0_9CLOT|nr:HD domain-containing protein [Clostridium rhizosphaerae]MBL4936985.1 HD domain-containing protein [Clostridium rhizosphaerae]